MILHSCLATCFVCGLQNSFSTGKHSSNGMQDSFGTITSTGLHSVCSTLVHFFPVEGFGTVTLTTFGRFLHSCVVVGRQTSSSTGVSTCLVTILHFSTSTILHSLVGMFLVTSLHTLVGTSLHSSVGIVVGTLVGTLSQLAVGLFKQTGFRTGLQTLRGTLRHNPFGPFPFGPFPFGPFPFRLGPFPFPFGPLPFPPMTGAFGAP